MQKGKRRAGEQPGNEAKMVLKGRKGVLFDEESETHAWQALNMDIEGSPRGSEGVRGRGEERNGFREKKRPRNRAWCNSRTEVRRGKANLSGERKRIGAAS